MKISHAGPPFPLKIAKKKKLTITSHLMERGEARRGWQVARVTAEDRDLALLQVSSEEHASTAHSLHMTIMARAWVGVQNEPLTHRGEL